jgi:hypothetical protein
MNGLPTAGVQTKQETSGMSNALPAMDKVQHNAGNFNEVSHVPFSHFPAVQSVAIRYRIPIDRVSCDRIGSVSLGLRVAAI